MPASSETTKSMFTLIGDREIQTSRTFRASRALVWEAMTKPEHVSQWYGPRKYSIPVCELDFRVGGKWRIVNRDDAGQEFAFFGVYREIFPMTRVVQTWNFEPMPGHESIETASLQEHDGQTTLTLHSRFQSAADRDGIMQSGMEEGARETHDRLAERIEMLQALAGELSELVITRTFDAPVPLVWEAWTDPQRFAKWWAPGVKFNIAKFELRPGGACLYGYSAAWTQGKEIWGKFLYRSIEGPHRLVFVSSTTDAHGHNVPNPMMPGFPLEVLNVVTLSEESGKTTVTLRGGPLNATPEQMATFRGAQKQLEGGFKGTFNSLEEYLKGEMATVANGDIYIERTFDAPVELLWKAWSDPEMLRRWWGPKDYSCPAAKIDFRVGGKILAAMRGPDGKDIWSGGIYTEIVPLKRIVSTDFFADEHGNVVPATHYGFPTDFPAMVVTVTFEAQGKKTKMTLHHSGHPKEIAKLAEMGWNQQLDKLVEALRAA